MNRSTFFKATRLLLTAFTVCAAPTAAEPIELSMGEALARVERENLRVLLNREAVEEALAAVRRQRSPLLPEVNLEVVQTRSQFANIGRGFDTGGAGQPPPANRFDARLAGSVPLIDPFLIASYQAAKAGVDITKEEAALVTQEVMRATAEIYLIHLRNLKRFRVIESNIVRGEVLLELAQNQLDAGVATQIDVTRAEVQLAIEEQAKLQQENLVYQSELFLKRLLNLDLQRSLEVRDYTANRRLEGAEPDVEAGNVFPDRPEYRSARARLAQNELERRAAGWERFPAIRAFGDYGYVSPDAFDTSRETAWTVGVALTMPLFEGYRISSNRRQAISRIRSSELRIRDLEQEISAELLQAWNDLRSRLAQINVAQKSVQLANEEIRLARIRFEQGVADNREIIDAQNRLAQTEDTYVEAVHQFNLARLEYARGKGDVRLLLADQQTAREEVVPGLR